MDFCQFASRISLWEQKYGNSAVCDFLSNLTPSPFPSREGEQESKPLSVSGRGLVRGSKNKLHIAWVHYSNIIKLRLDTLLCLSHLSNKWHHIPILCTYDNLSYEQIWQMRFDDLYKKYEIICKFWSLKKNPINLFAYLWNMVFSQQEDLCSRSFWGKENRPS